MEAMVKGRFSQIHGTYCSVMSREYQRVPYDETGKCASFIDESVTQPFDLIDSIPSHSQLP